MAGLSGNYHRDTMRIRHHEHQQVALEQIRDLHSRIERTDKNDIAAELSEIFKTLDAKLS
jgi:uncharacterized protein (UPF0335 family)